MGNFKCWLWHNLNDHSLIVHYFIEIQDPRDDVVPDQFYKVKSQTLNVKLIYNDRILRIYAQACRKWFKVWIEPQWTSTKATIAQQRIIMNYNNTNIICDSSDLPRDEV